MAGERNVSRAAARSAVVKRKTGETEVEVHLRLDGGGKTAVATGVGFFDHMLETLACHGRLGLEVRASGDLHVDPHHLVEDVGIALGRALREALGTDLRIRRFASAYAPLDDALARAVVDLGGRSYFHFAAALAAPAVGSFPSELVEEFFRAFVQHGRLNLHLDLIRGRNTHHQVEALFKAAALALRAALELEPGLDRVPSTKGTLNCDEALANPRSAEASRPGGPRELPGGEEEARES